MVPNNAELWVYSEKLSDFWINAQCSVIKEKRTRVGHCELFDCQIIWFTWEEDHCLNLDWVRLGMWTFMCLHCFDEKVAFYHNIFCWVQRARRSKNRLSAETVLDTLLIHTAWMLLLLTWAMQRICTAHMLLMSDLRGVLILNQLKLVKNYFKSMSIWKASQRGISFTNTIFSELLNSTTKYFNWIRFKMTLKSYWLCSRAAANDYFYRWLIYL